MCNLYWSGELALLRKVSIHSPGSTLTTTITTAGAALKDRLIGPTLLRY
jgi:hypothetical protein